jgi:ABC-type sugar transport system permease subunit
LGLPLYQDAFKYRGETLMIKSLSPTKGSQSPLVSKKIPYLDRVSESRYGFLVTAPSLLVLLVIAVYPICWVIYLSMMKFDSAMQTKFVGLGNYIGIFQDAKFYLYLQHSLIYTFGAVLISFSVGLILALSLNSALKYTGFLRTVALWTWAIPPVVASVTWKWIFNDVMGVLNDLLLRCGLINHPIPWLSDSTTALISLFLTHAWTDIPFVMILLLAGLQSIPNELYEAAGVDGASPWQQFAKVTFPLLKPTMMVALLISTTFAFRTFDIVFTLTRGGPGDATELLVTYLYNNAFQFLRFGYASALSVVMVLFTIGFILIYSRIFKTDDY